MWGWAPIVDIYKLSDYSALCSAAFQFNRTVALLLSAYREPIWPHAVLSVKPAYDDMTHILIIKNPRNAGSHSLASW